MPNINLNIKRVFLILLIFLIYKTTQRDMRFIMADRSRLGQKCFPNSKASNQSYGPTP